MSNSHLERAVKMWQNSREKNQGLEEDVGPGFPGLIIMEKEDGRIEIPPNLPPRLSSYGILEEDLVIGLGSDSALKSPSMEFVAASHTLGGYRSKNLQVARCVLGGKSRVRCCHLILTSLFRQNF